VVPTPAERKVSDPVAINHGTETDSLTAHITIEIPGMKDTRPSFGQKEWIKNPPINEHLDMCQECAREVYDFIKKDS
jgi:hypothetical protein